MDKQQKLKIALPILVVVMVVVWGPVFFDGESKKKETKSPGSSNTNVSGKASNADLLSLIRSSKRNKARTTYEEWGRNPFTQTQGAGAVLIEGILWDANDPKAMINGYILGVGDKVGSAVITEIKPRSVTIKQGSKETELQL